MAKIIHPKNTNVIYNNHKSWIDLIQCGVPQPFIHLIPLLFLLYINDLSAVSKANLYGRFTDDISMFIAGNDMNGVQNQVNGDLVLVQ